MLELCSSTACGWVFSFLPNTSYLHAQAPGWQPNRLPPSSSMQPLAGNAGNSTTPAANRPAIANTATADQGNSGVVLRWRTSARASDGSQQASTTNNGSTIANQAAAPTASSSMAARVLDANTMRPSSAADPRVQAAQYQTARVSTELNSTAPNNSGAGNPLRSTAVTNNVRTTAALANAFVPRGYTCQSAQCRAAG